MKRIRALSKSSARILLLLLFVFVLIALYSFFVVPRRCEKISCITIPMLPPKPDIDLYENSRDAYRALYKGDHEKIRIAMYQTKDANTAELRNQATIMKIDSLYENARSPYPGTLSEIISCENKYKPKPFIFQSKDSTMTLYKGYLNNRLQYGTCIDNQITQKVYSALFFCDNHSSWYQLELIIPVNAAEPDEYFFNQLKNTSCQRAS